MNEAAGGHAMFSWGRCEKVLGAADAREGRAAIVLATSATTSTAAARGGGGELEEIICTRIRFIYV